MYSPCGFRLSWTLSTYLCQSMTLKTKAFVRGSSPMKLSMWAVATSRCVIGNSFNKNLATFSFLIMFGPRKKILWTWKGQSFILTNFFKNTHDVATTFIFQILAPCNDVLDNSTIWAGISYGVFFAVLNLLVSKLASRRKLVLIVTFIVSAASGILLNLVYEPIANMILYVLLQATSIGLGITASYCVDLYPTSIR